MSTTDHDTYLKTLEEILDFIPDKIGWLESNYGWGSYNYTKIEFWTKTCAIVLYYGVEVGGCVSNSRIYLHKLLFKNVEKGGSGNAITNFDIMNIISDRVEINRRLSELDINKEFKRKP